jgi:hypothetical protein
MDTYDERVVAGHGPHRFTEILLDLTTFVGIPPLVFYGKM